MPTTCAHPPAPTTTLPELPRDVDLGRLFADLAAELARAVDQDAITAAVEALTAVALRLGTEGSWPAGDSSSGRSGIASPPSDGARSFTLFGIREERPGPRWRALFSATWPAYRAWYLQDGEDARPDLATARAQLTRHMPELVSTWEAMVALTGDDDVAARLLTLWDAPAFAPGCSQAAQVGGDPIMVRNYDYSPELFEWVVYSSEFTGRKVIGTSDCLWGLLDGMNDDGLVISLTYGGRQSSAPGFAIPLVVRYLLEVAGTVGEARAALDRLPVAASYNLTLMDAAGAVVTAFVSPGNEPEYADSAVATNHRGRVPERPEHARALRSVERQDRLLELLAEPTRPTALAAAFLRPPLHNQRYAQGFGTLYTAAYRPRAQELTYSWPEVSFTRTFDSPDDSITVSLQEG
ncbi:MAG: C45 family autoproteolytic acyltransferase/hydrolase [Nocardioidaceae bacterium]